jgi:multimeric flavodoxin WrbA
MDAADLIVFFVPLSYSSMPSDMKRAMERLFPETTPFFYHNHRTKLTAHPVQKNKKSQAFLQFLVWGFPEMHHGRILEENFNEWAKHSHKYSLGSIKRPGINMILGDPRMQSIRKQIREAIAQTAKSIYETGIVPKKQKKIIEKEDYISVKDFQFYATKYWIKRFKTDFWN